MLENGTIDRLRDRGTAIHARNIYLQGLLLTPAGEWPDWVSTKVRAHQKSFEKLAQRKKCRLIDLALGFAKEQKDVECIVLGICNMRELQELQKTWLPNQLGKRMNGGTGLLRIRIFWIHVTGRADYGCSFSEALKRCKRCLLPETHETLVLDEEGICNVCRGQEVKANINWGERLNQLDTLIEQYRGRYRYDCLIPFSGGKDSTWTLYYLMNRYPGLNPLVVRFNHGFLRPNLKRNCDRVFRKLGVDVHDFTPNWKVVQRLMLQSFLEKGTSAGTVIREYLHIQCKWQLKSKYR